MTQYFHSLAGMLSRQSEDQQAFRATALLQILYFSLFQIIIKRLNDTARILLTVIRLAQKP